MNEDNYQQDQTNNLGMSRRAFLGSMLAAGAAGLTGCQMSGMDYQPHIKGGLDSLAQNSTMYKGEVVYLRRAQKEVDRIDFDFDSSLVDNVNAYYQGDSLFVAGDPKKDGVTDIGFTIHYSDGSIEKGAKQVFVDKESNLERLGRYSNEDRSRLNGLIDGVYVDIREGENYGKRFMPEVGQVYFEGRDYVIVPAGLLDAKALRAEAWDDSIVSWDRFIDSSLGKGITGKNALWAYTGEKGQIVTCEVTGPVERYDAALASMLRGGTNGLELVVTSVSNDELVRMAAGAGDISDAALEAARRFAPFAGTESLSMLVPVDKEGRLELVPFKGYLTANNEGEVASPGAGVYLRSRREHLLSKIANIAIAGGSLAAGVIAVTSSSGGSGSTTVVFPGGKPGVGPGGVPLPP